MEPCFVGSLYNHRLVEVKGFSVENDIVQMINIQSNLVGKNLQRYTKSVLLIRGTRHQYSLAWCVYIQ